MNQNALRKIPFPSNKCLSKIKAYFLGGKKNYVLYFSISLQRKSILVENIITILKKNP